MDALQLGRYSSQVLHAQTWQTNNTIEYQQTKDTQKEQKKGV